MQDLEHDGSVLLLTNNKTEVKRQFLWIFIIIIIIIIYIPLGLTQASDQCLKQLSCCWKT